MVSVPHDERTGLCTSTRAGKFSKINHLHDCTVQGEQHIENSEAGAGHAGSYTNQNEQRDSTALTPKPAVTEMTLLRDMTRRSLRVEDRSARLASVAWSPPKQGDGTDLVLDIEGCYAC